MRVCLESKQFRQEATDPGVIFLDITKPQQHPLWYSPLEASDNILGM